jgi:O-antigen/teichoic acid export membrane protein
MTSETQPPAGEPDAAASHAPAVLRSTALQVSGHGLAIALTAASTIVLTRFLGVDGYGRFTVLTVFLLIGVSLSEFGLNGTAIRWFARGEQPEEIFASLIGLRLVISTLAAGAALLVFALYPHRDAPLAAALLTAAAIVLAGVNLTIPTALQARLDFRLAVGLDLTARGVSFATYALAAIAVASRDPDTRLVAAALGLSAGYLVAVVVGLFAVSRMSFPILPAFHPEIGRAHV